MKGAEEPGVLIVLCLDFQTTIADVSDCQFFMEFCGLYCLAYCVTLFGTLILISSVLINNLQPLHVVFILKLSLIGC